MKATQYTVISEKPLEIEDGFDIDCPNPVISRNMSDGILLISREKGVTFIVVLEPNDIEEIIRIYYKPREIM